MAYTNSSLVSYTKLSPNHSGQRTHSIDRITPHCVVGQCSVETLGNIFMPTSKDASCNYGIGSDGRVLLCVEEKNRSWCSSSNANDQRAVTIECASDSYHPYAFKDCVYQTLIKLCADICKRNGKTKILWFGDKDKTLNYAPASNEMVLTVHRWFANKACPGDWLYNRMGDLAKQVNTLLSGGSQPTPNVPGLYPGPFPVTVLKSGSNGSQVVDLQNFLNWYGSYGLDVDGIFGVATEKAVKDFQTNMKIEVDGIFGAESLAKAKTAKKKSTVTPAPSNTYSGNLPTIELSQGDYNSQVADLQKFLNWYGNYGLDVDSSFGPATDKAVRDFQRNEGIKVDGIFGAGSRAAAKKATKKSSSTTKKYTGTIPTSILKRGNTGTQVKYLQQFLNWYSNYKLDVDGIFGVATENALKNFQKIENIEVDGIYGAESRKTAQKYK